LPQIKEASVRITPLGTPVQAAGEANSARLGDPECAESWDTWEKSVWCQ
jgi:hypothetical protein